MLSFPEKKSIYPRPGICLWIKVKIKIFFQSWRSEFDVWIIVKEKNWLQQEVLWCSYACCDTCNCHRNKVYIRYRYRYKYRYRYRYIERLLFNAWTYMLFFQKTHVFGFPELTFGGSQLFMCQAVGDSSGILHHLLEFVDASKYEFRYPYTYKYT